MHFGGKRLEALPEERFTGGSVAQGTPDDHFETLRYAVHDPDRQGRLANAAQSEHAHHSTTLLHYPGSQEVQFPLTSKESRDSGRITPIDAQSTTSGRSEGRGRANGLLGGL